MPSVIKSVAYSYIDSGPNPYSFDAICIEHGKVTLDVHQRFATREAFFEGILQVVPVFNEGGDNTLTSETIPDD